MSEAIDILSFTVDQLSTEKLGELIRQRQSFEVKAVINITTVVNKLEGAIETQGLRCRVYTEYRSAAIAGVAVPTGITQVTGLATALGVGVHNLVTFNPDYEIAKNKLNGTITVKYKK